MRFFVLKRVMLCTGIVLFLSCSGTKNDETKQNTSDENTPPVSTPAIEPTSSPKTVTPTPVKEPEPAPESKYFDFLASTGYKQVVESPEAFCEIQKTSFETAKKEGRLGEFVDLEESKDSNWDFTCEEGKFFGPQDSTINLASLAELTKPSNSYEEARLLWASATEETVDEMEEDMEDEGYSKQAYFLSIQNDKGWYIEKIISYEESGDTGVSMESQGAYIEANVTQILMVGGTFTNGGVEENIALVCWLEPEAPSCLHLRKAEEYDEENKPTKPDARVVELCQKFETVRDKMKLKGYKIEECPS